MEKARFSFSDFVNKTVKETLEILKTSEKGLSQQEAEQRLSVFGFNEIPSKKAQWFDILLCQFKSPFCYLLFIAAVVSLIIGEKVDGLFILLFVFINVVLGFIQEYRAEKALEILKTFLPNQIRIIRDGEEIIIDKKYLVPGDVVTLKAGDIVPTDLRIIEAHNLIVDESILTGESKKVLKSAEPLSCPTKELFEATNIIFSGTSIENGEAKAVVISNVKDSAVGKIAKLVAGISRESAYEKELLDFSKLILRIVLFFIVTIFVLRLITNSENIFDFLLFCIALIVSILPEALPTVVIFSLSQGAIRLAKRKVVVKRLAAIEDLGNIKVLCSDKTGTLTENKMVLDEIVAENKEKTLLFALLSSDYLSKEEKAVDNEFDVAIFKKTADNLKQKIKEYRFIAKNPFDLKRLINSNIVEDKSGQKYLVVKGAAEKILEKTIGFDGNQSCQEIEEKIKQYGQQGKRTLAVAYRALKDDDSAENINNLENNFSFLGFLVFIDPLKKTAKPAIKLAEKLGVRAKIITGDSKEVAGYIGYQIGLIKNPSEVITGKELEMLSEGDFEKKCEEIDVFARISSEMKYRIVETLQKKHEVGFLGEGINDAPALKIANVAIVVNTAADISREIADIILLENDLGVIVEGVSRGRKIFANLNKYIKTTVASNFGNFYSIALISLFIPFLPMLPIQILTVNLLSDFPMIAIATDNVEADELKQPKNYQMKNMLPLIILLALVSTIFDFIFFATFYHTGEKNLQTLWFIESILTELMIIYAVRTSKIFYKGSRPSYPLIFFTIIAIFLTLILPLSHFGINFLHFQKPTTASILIVLLLVIIYFILSDITKRLYLTKWKDKKFLKFLER
ncbi:MAG: cation-translocating P-type ATPase [Minisyncoccia bacterium]